MPLSEKLEYSGLYTEFANNEVHRLDERAAWIELANYDGATELDHQDLMRLQGLITRARLRLRAFKESLHLQFVWRIEILQRRAKTPHCGGGLVIRGNRDAQ